MLDVLLGPLTWALLFLLAGVYRGDRPRLARAARALPIAGLFILYVFSIEPVANALWKGTEAPPLTTEKPGVTYDAVIVLGGLVDEDAVATYGLPSYNDNIERLLTGRDLMVSGKARNVLISGGSSGQGRPPEARVLGKQLEDWGVDPAHIFLEEKSRNTHENAAYSAALVRREGWKSVLLVTSAFHMRRALACFVHEGLAVDTLSVDFRSCDCPVAPGDFLPRAGALEMSTAALRELSGRVVYRLRGYSSALP